ncbi:DUF7373 family lipoprotein [Nocardia seriolae]|uniref:DUF7373 family lipoprotein n=1 Tax=Nocardia seriolae TaxID=37332 RepID=UPI0011C46090|nr:hypothetical protein [Nocardia seriolae]MTJ74583.1 hypothetical protein [Nocardia seriolae]MTJ89375.1 hypothetical protein [Nocardia seriolae]MTK33351.1 hypothetical protein [Nocardia seriolae]MTK49943.1 hypothetical protein [Nocardia seriolae]MTL14909.1 hypothetical protein [Nocardia seriolae]
MAGGIGLSARTIRRCATGALTAALLLTGCSVPGHPRPAPPDLTALDLGPYSSDPPAAAPVGTEADGRVLESVRMGEAVIDPIEADPTLKYGLGNAASVPIPAAQKAVYLSEPVRAVLAEYGMLAGFSVGGMDSELNPSVAVGHARLLNVMLLRFPDAAAAERAAARIDAVDAAVSTENVPVSIPDHPGAHAHWRPGVPTLAATRAQDAYVITVLAGYPATDLAALTGMARNALTAQVTRLHGFQPTPVGAFAALPLDTDGMLARMLPEAPGVWPRPTVLAPIADKNAGWRARLLPSGVVYGPRASHRWGSWKKDDSTGDAVIALRGTNLLVRFPTPVAAREEFLATADEVSGDGMRAASPPAGIPDARCMESVEHGPYEVRFACRALYGVYDVQVFSRTLVDAQRRIAAQYALLVRSA